MCVYISKSLTGLLELRISDVSVLRISEGKEQICKFERNKQLLCIILF